jgi:hypothetical protein
LDSREHLVDPEFYEDYPVQRNEPDWDGECVQALLVSN